MASPFGSEGKRKKEKGKMKKENARHHEVPGSFFPFAFFLFHSAEGR
jgi:hypothetical protein